MADTDRMRPLEPITDAGAPGNAGTRHPSDLRHGAELLSDLEAPVGWARRLHLVAVRALDPIVDPFAVGDDGMLDQVASALATVAADHGGRAYRVGNVIYAVITPDVAPAASFVAPAVQGALADVHPALGRGLLHTSVVIQGWSAQGPSALRTAFAQLRARSAWLPLSPARQARDVLLQLLTERRVHGSRASHGTAALHAVAISRALELPAGEVDEIVRAAELQDVGMLTLPDGLLDKRGRLDEDEWDLVRQHPLAGERVVGSAPALRAVARIVRSCYERYDGSGYPDGLAGDAIPLGARIIAPCVAFDAMRSSRPHRPALSTAAALRELEASAGLQFDPRIVALFRRIFADQPPRP